MQNVLGDALQDEAWFSAVWMREKEQIQAMAPQNLCKVDEMGQTALMHAARRGFSDLFPLLTKELGMQDMSGKTALMHAISFGKSDCVAGLLAECGKQDQEGFTAVMHAVLQNDFEAFEQLQSELELTNNQLQTALHIAAQLGSDFFVDEIVKAAPQLLGKKEMGGRTALFYAVVHDVQELVVPLLPEAGITDDIGFTALRIALQVEASSVLKTLAAVPGEMQGLDERDIRRLVELEALDGTEAEKIITKLNEQEMNAGGVVDDDPDNVYAQWLKKQTDAVDDIADDEILRLREQLGCLPTKPDLDAELAEEDGQGEE